VGKWGGKLSNCTIGAKILSPGSEFLLFKNKDFRRRDFDDRLVVRKGLFAVEGARSWDGRSTDVDVFSGFSIGVNSSGLACCDSNVEMKPGAKNYDILTQEILEKCRSIDDAVNIVEKAVYAQRYSWGNIIVAAKDEVAAFQVASSVKVFRNSNRTVRTNHHIEHGRRQILYDKSTGSIERYEVAKRLLEKVEDVDGAFELLRSHEYGLGTSSICSHGRFNTVYAYVVHFKNDRVVFYVCRGNPCAGKFVAVTLDLDDEKLLRMAVEAYPSGRKPQYNT
jgi:predicted choloylglycine hydrolase